MIFSFFLLFHYFYIKQNHLFLTNIVCKIIKFLGFSQIHNYTVQTDLPYISIMKDCFVFGFLYCVPNKTKILNSILVCCKCQFYGSNKTMTLQTIFLTINHLFLTNIVCKIIIFWGFSQIHNYTVQTDLPYISIMKDCFVFGFLYCVPNKTKISNSILVCCKC